MGIMTAQAFPLCHRLMWVGLLFGLLMTIETECRDLIHQSKTHTIGRRVGGPGRFVTSIAVVFGWIVHHLFLQQVTMTAETISFGRSLIG
jgi:hypothetical protein